MVAYLTSKQVFQHMYIVYVFKVDTDRADIHL